MPDRPKRWRFVPPLWTLVLVAVMLGVSAFYLTVWRPYAERVAIVTGTDGPHATITAVVEHGPEWIRTITSRGWLHGTSSDVPIGLLDEVQGLVLRYSDADDQYLPRLQVFSHLQELYLDHTHVTDAGLKHLARHQSLEYLNLSHNRIYGGGFNSLRTLPHLKGLSLSYTPIHDAQLETLMTFPELEHVGVHACRHLTPSYVDRVVAERPGWLDGIESLQWSWEDEARKRARGDPAGPRPNVTRAAPVVELAQ